MLSAGEIAQIKDEIMRLEKAREACTDNCIRQTIKTWIDEKKRRLASGINRHE
jgi:hypothetical protein